MFAPLAVENRNFLLIEQTYDINLSLFLFFLKFARTTTLLTLAR